MVTIVLEQPHFSPLGHKEAHARPGRANHFRKHSLVNLRQLKIGSLVFVLVGKNEKQTRQALLTEIQTLINEIRFDSAVSLQKLRSKPSQQFWPIVKQRTKFSAFQPHNCAFE